MFGKKNTKKRHDSRQVQADELIGKNLNFGATEAYKLLRTNQFFCLPPSDESKCPVVGVTSSVQGEGKSTTSVNLAYMLAEDGKRVCLIEGDMRAPTLRKRLNINNSVGLSHVLAGLETVQSAISTLSASEIEAVRYIFEELDGDEGILVASKVADRVGITRSVIVNALRKLESAEVIESRSSGMKGTYIRILNKLIVEELEK